MRLQYYFKNIQKRLRVGFISSSGRNYLGTICVHHKGSGSKKRSYFVDFFRRVNCLGYILKIVQTPFYTAFLGFVTYQNGLSNFVLLPDGLAVGSQIYMGSFFNPEKDKFSNFVGSSLPLSYVNLFNLVSMLNWRIIKEVYCLVRQVRV